jgi:hypothetical protein
MRLRARTAAALLAFLLAAEIVAGVGGHFYLEAKYPVQTTEIKRTLETPLVQDIFKVAEARKDGYTDEQIASFLADRNAVTRLELSEKFGIVCVSVWLVAALVLVGLVLISSESRSKNGAA